ncbi:membrane-bound lytic murein transglycosylase, putative [Bdellovibrio bacteriovorus W]|nr:membrane-bound lytic murein transglycosylase, putative [Bdellovibrio bacteriovorus W]
MIKVSLLQKAKNTYNFKRPLLLSLACLTLPIAVGTVYVDRSGVSNQNFVEIEAPLILKKQIPSYDDAKINALADAQERIGEEFQISDLLKDRVGFWFDIYAKYDSNQRVIHHTLYPWIVYKVVDVSEIINADMPKARWMRNQKADALVKQEVQAIRKALKKISNTGKADTNNEAENLVVQALAPLKGNLKVNARKALKAVRTQTGQKNYFSAALEVSPLYLSGMEEIFEQHRLPKELTRLPFVESSFNKHAVSRVGASGIWQFMDYTGKSFMTVNKYIDERKSPFKATQAAAKLLKENHLILRKSWPLAITAWNHGPPGVRRAIKKTNSTDLGKILNHPAKTFDFASTNFYSEFLAALYVEKYHDQLFENLNYEETLDLHAVRLAKATGAKKLYEQSGLSQEDFLFFNPDLRNAFKHNSQIPKGFTVMVDTPARALLASLLTKETRAPIEESIADITKN